MRAPFTSIVFAFELTHDANVFLPLLVGGVIAHAFTVLTLKRSILTEKIARRGYHLSREYAVDPLELLYVREVMRADVLTLPEGMLLGEVLSSPQLSRWHVQRLVPVLDEDGGIVGVFTSGDLHQWLKEKGNENSARSLRELVRTEFARAVPEEPLRAAVHRMAEEGITRFPVMEPGTEKFLGILSLDDLLKARTRHLEEERRREKTLGIRSLDGSRGGPRKTGSAR